MQLSKQQKPSTIFFSNQHSAQNETNKAIAFRGMTCSLLLQFFHL